MPSFEFTGFQPYDYPETRDAKGAFLGTVKPGDPPVDMDAPPDGNWRELPAGGGDKPPAKGRKAASTSDQAGTSGSDEAGSSGKEG